ncbi:MAG: OmpA family protein [Polyangiaceae bacterium]
MNAIRLTPVLVFFAAACSATQSQPARTAQAPVTHAPMPSVAAQKSPERSLVQIDEEIRKACNVSDDDAYFHFDSSRVTENEHGVLKRVAVCFESGPLKGRSMQLVGHADPRGDSEYNIVLGGSRADAVKNFMRQQGLADAKMATSSRGEFDATGTNEATWAKDRRVDMMLAR